MSVWDSYVVLVVVPLSPLPVVVVPYVVLVAVVVVVIILHQVVAGYGLYVVVGKTTQYCFCCRIL